MKKNSRWILTNIKRPRKKYQTLMLLEEKKYRSLIIDDDPVYHMILDKFFNYSITFDEHIHYINGQEALNFLIQNCSKPTTLPDVIFLDINMPEMGAWKFLDKYSSLSNLLEKQIAFYLMTNFVQKDHQENLKVYPYVKGVFAKTFDVNFLNSIAI